MLRGIGHCIGIDAVVMGAVLVAASLVNHGA
jgi:hypothetical protein